MAINFGRLAVELIYPVIEQYGFAIVSQEPAEAVFESEKVWFCVARERGSNAIDARLMLTQFGRDYNIPELVAWRNIERPSLVADDAAACTTILRWIAEFLAKNCVSLLHGDRRAFADLDRAADLHSEIYTRKMEIQSAQGRARLAFDQGDFVAVRTILSEIEREIDDEHRDLLRKAKKRPP